MCARRTRITQSEAHYLLDKEAHSRQTIFYRRTRTVDYRLLQFDLGLNSKFPKLQAHETITYTPHPFEQTVYYLVHS